MAVTTELGEAAGTRHGQSRKARTPAEREAIAAEFRRMGNDPHYQGEARQLCDEFAQADAEAAAYIDAE